MTGTLAEIGDALKGLATMQSVWQPREIRRCAADALSALHRLTTKVERLETDLKQAQRDAIGTYYKGMEEAAKWMKRRGIHPYTVREFREWSAAKQLTGEVGSNF